MIECSRVTAVTRPAVTAHVDEAVSRAGGVRCWKSHAISKGYSIAVTAVTAIVAFCSFLAEFSGESDGRL